LLQSVENLVVLLEKRKIDYALVGGIALRHYIERAKYARFGFTHGSFFAGKITRAQD
jgi:hypothetical protein